VCSEKPATDDALAVKVGVPVEFLTTEELLEELAKRGHNYVLVYADSTLDNEPTNMIVDFTLDGSPVDEDQPDGRATNGPWLLWALAQAYVVLYDKNLSWREAEDGALSDRARVNNRLRRIYHECESLIDTTPEPFLESES